MREYVRGAVWIIAILAAITTLLFLFVLDSWVIPSDDPLFALSLEPTLAPQDRIVVQRGGIPKTGQLARCISPEKPAKYVIGRMFGAGGETVEITAERITVAGRGTIGRHGCPPRKVLHPVLGTEVTLGCGVEENSENWTYQVLYHPENPEPSRVVAIPEGMIYLVSDDRHFHEDSRDFGPIAAATCEHVVFRLWGASYMDSSRRFSILW